jgi:flagellar biogenesis protein FliO
MRRALLFGSLSACAAAQSAWAQTLGRAPDDEISLWRVGIALLFCVVLAIAGAFLLRARLGQAPLFAFPTKSGRRLKMVETLRLGRVIALSIVECDGKELLVMSSEERAELLARLPMDTAARISDTAP